MKQQYCVGDILKQRLSILRPSTWNNNNPATRTHDSNNCNDKSYMYNLYVFKRSIQGISNV